jgi:hypothetical protein
MRTQKFTKKHAKRDLSAKRTKLRANRREKSEFNEQGGY